MCVASLSGSSGRVPLEVLRTLGSQNSLSQEKVKGCIASRGRKEHENGANTFCDASSGKCWGFWSFQGVDDACPQAKDPKNRQVRPQNGRLKG